MEQLNIELARKRKALDKEIEKFMAVKEVEFRKFEKELRSQLDSIKSETLKTNSEKQSPMLISRGFTVGPFVKASTPEIGDQTKKESSAEVQSLNDTHAGAAVAVENDVSTQNIEQLSHLRRRSSREEQGIELAAPFTPAYLPLLDGLRSHRKALSMGESPRISTSLTIQGNMPDEDERPDLPDRRSSSSPTSTGQSLKKSSMRRPDSSGSDRERKHVLFAIDDQLMSPGSSPLATRSRYTNHPPNPLLGSRDPPIDTNQPFDLVAAIPLDRSSFQSSTLVSSRSYKDLVEPTVIPSPNGADLDDFQSFSKDPLFDNGEFPLPLDDDDDEWNLSPVQTRSDEEEDPLKAFHTGSVPIQIQPSSRM